jgi:hypothetical protein
MVRFPAVLTALGFVAIGLLGEMAAVSIWSVSGFWSSPGPDSMEEVLLAVQERGLYCRSDRGDGVVTHRLIISDQPVSLYRANLIRFGDPQHYCWYRLAAVTWPARSNLGNYDPDYSVIWGDMLVYGDPVILQKLTGQRD